MNGVEFGLVRGIAHRGVYLMHENEVQMLLDLFRLLFR
jgi:hypothetical protein